VCGGNKWFGEPARTGPVRGQRRVARREERWDGGEGEKREERARAKKLT